MGAATVAGAGAGAGAGATLLGAGAGVITLGGGATFLGAGAGAGATLLGAGAGALTLGAGATFLGAGAGAGAGAGVEEFGVLGIEKELSTGWFCAHTIPLLIKLKALKKPTPRVNNKCWVKMLKWLCFFGASFVMSVLLLTVKKYGCQSTVAVVLECR